jgi:hypothetical protein
MELFLLIRKSAESHRDLPADIRDGFFDSDCLVADLGGYTLYLNKKSLLPSPCHYACSMGSACGTGTFAYRSGDPQESLQLLLDDTGSGRFDPGALLGHYFIFIVLPRAIKVLTDGTGLVRAYHDGTGTWLSSSFILAARLAGRLTLNRAAAAENLVTGGITGHETLVSGITSFSRGSTALFKGIDFIIPQPGNTGGSRLKRTEAIQRQSDSLAAYFSSFSRLAGKQGADIGLTGGYDSRLILACALNRIGNLQVHSHHRPAGSKEWEIAREIAGGEGIRFVSPEVTPPGAMDDDMLLATITGSYGFNDGVITLHCNWMEEYNTPGYRREVLGDRRLGFSGIGGEQYRNHDRLYGKPWLFSRWVRYAHTGKISGMAFTDSKAAAEALERIRLKICGMLGFHTAKRWIDLYDLKRIQNEVLVPAYRGARTDAENRHSWFLSPLADFHVSSSAYGIIRFLDDSKSFEAALIRNISPSLAAYRTDYGYDLMSGEPFTERIFGSAFENLLPAPVKWRVKERLRSRGNAGEIVRRINSSPLLKRYVDNVVSAGLPVRVMELAARESTAHMVTSLGFLLEKMNISTGQ